MNPYDPVRGRTLRLERRRKAYSLLAAAEASGLIIGTEQHQDDMVISLGPGHARQRASGNGSAGWFGSPAPNRVCDGRNGSPCLPGRRSAVEADR